MVISSPKYPQSNGLAERNVQTIKKLLKKAREGGNDEELALLELRNTVKLKSYVDSGGLKQPFVNNVTVTFYQLV